MITKKTNKVIDKLAEGSKAHEEMLKKRAILAHPNYLDLTQDLLTWALRCAMKNPTEQIAFISNSNRDKVKYLLTYLQATKDEFKSIGRLTNLYFFNQYLDLSSNESTEHIVSLIRKRCNKKRKISANGGVIVVDNLDEVIFPIHPQHVPSNKTVMKNIEKLTAWHKHQAYSVVFGTVTSPIPTELHQIFGGYWDIPTTYNEDNYDNDSNKH